MKVIRALHILYLTLLLVFIYFFFNTYQPFKLHQVCAEESAKEVLKLNPQDSYGYYKNLYEKCYSQKTITLTSFLPR